jgi:hypothetical protein
MDRLKGILRDGFYPHYCQEYRLTPEDLQAAARKLPPKNALAMVCFCDLPLSLIRNHVIEYGGFGIGLRKEWGLRNRLNPVAYTHKRANTRPLFARMATRATKTKDSKALREIQYLDAFTKPFRGPAIRGRRFQKMVPFYDEREWRYVPSVQSSPPLSLDRPDFENTTVRNRWQRLFLKKHALPIHPDDIQYLIVPYDRDETNILVLHDFLRRIYSRRDAILVTSAILTYDCIEDDI